MNRKELLKKLMNKPVAITIENYGDYLVKGLNTMDYLFAASNSADEEGNITQEKYFASIVVRCTLDTDGKRLFADEDLEVVTEAEAGFVLPLALKIQELSGTLDTEEDVKKA